jgi:ribonuclease HI
MSGVKPHAFLFVDGSSSRKDDIGAWAAVVANNTSRKILYGINYPTTISRCELMPIIAGLRWIRSNWSLRTGMRVQVYSDSEYTVQTLSGQFPKNKNKDLWAGVQEAATGLTVTYTWRERNSLPYMELCDTICGSFRKMMIREATLLNPNDPRKLEEYMPMYELPDVCDVQPVGSEQQ